MKSKRRVRVAAGTVNLQLELNFKVSTDVDVEKEPSVHNEKLNNVIVIKDFQKKRIRKMVDLILLQAKVF